MKGSENMAFTWVSELKSAGGTIIKLGVPAGLTFSKNSGNPGGSELRLYASSAGASNYAAVVAACADLSQQNVVPNLDETTGSSIALKSGGGFRVTRSAAYPSAGTIYLYYTNPSLITTTQANFSGGGGPSNPQYTVRSHGMGICIAMDTDLQEAYAGIIFWRDLYHPSPSYCSANIQIFIPTGFDTGANYNCYNAIKDSIPSGGGTGPYHTDDYDEPIQGDASYDDTSDTVENPALPVITANASGFVTAFVPTIGEINALANYMISPSFLQALGQSTLLGGFKDMILGLQVFPCTIAAGTAEQLWLYYPGVAINSGVLMGKATNQFVEIDCGDLEVEEYWGNCCDYNPYTKIGIFLPFCGFYDLDTDDVMGKTLNVSYRIDIMSGACLATIKVDGSVMYQYSGTCSAQIPLNSTSYDEFFKSMIELGTATATGGAGLLAAGASYNTALERSVNMSDKNGFMANAMMNEADAHYDMAKVNTASSLANSTVSNIIGSKAIYKHAGALGSSVGFLGVRKPYLIIKRPYQQIPDMYGKFHGYPCFTKANLNDLTGYTVVDDIRLNIPDATVDEILECEKLLKEGVVL